MKRLEVKDPDGLPSIPGLIALVLLFVWVYDAHKYRDHPEESSLTQLVQVTESTINTISRWLWPMTTICVIGDNTLGARLPNPLQIELPMLDSPKLCLAEYGTDSCFIYTERDRQDGDLGIAIKTANGKWEKFYRDEEVSCPQQPCDLELVWNGCCPVPKNLVSSPTLQVVEARP